MADDLPQTISVRNLRTLREVECAITNCATAKDLLSSVVAAFGEPLASGDVAFLFGASCGFLHPGTQIDLGNLVAGLKGNSLVFVLKSQLVGDRRLLVKPLEANLTSLEATISGRQWAQFNVDLFDGLIDTLIAETNAVLENTANILVLTRAEFNDVNVRSNSDAEVFRALVSHPKASDETKLQYSTLETFSVQVKEAMQAAGELADDHLQTTQNALELLAQYASRSNGRSTADLFLVDFQFEVEALKADPSTFKASASRLLRSFLDTFDGELILSRLSILSDLSLFKQNLAESATALQAIQGSVSKWNADHESLFQLLLSHALETNSKVLQDLRTQVSSINKEKHQALSAIGSLQLQLEQAAALTMANDREKEYLKKELQTSRRDLSNAMKQVLELQRNTNIKADQTAQQVQQEKLDLTKELQTANDLRQQLSLKVSELETRISTVQSQCKRQSGEIEQLTNANRTYLSQIESYTASEILLRAKSSGAEKEIKIVQDEINRLQRQHETTSAELQRVRERLAQSVQRMAAVDENMKSREAEISRLQTLLQTSSKAVSSITSAEDHKLISSLESKVKTLESQLCSVQVELATKEQSRKQFERAMVQSVEAVRIYHEALNDISRIFVPQAQAEPIPKTNDATTKYVQSVKSKAREYINGHQGSTDKSTLALQCTRADAGDTVVAVQNPDNPARYYVIGNPHLMLSDGCVRACVKFFREQPFIIGKVILKTPFETGFLLEVEPVRNALPKPQLVFY